MGKIFTISLILSFLFYAKSEAQRFSGGLRGGLVASEVSGDNLGGPNKLGWHASAFTFTPITETISLQLEIMYITKGSRSVPSERNNFFEYTFHLEYVEVPVLMLMDVSQFSQTPVLENLTLHAGLSGSVLVGYREEEDGAPIPPPGGQDFHPAELNIILGFAYPLSEKLNFQLSFSNSLTPIRPHASGETVWYNWGQYNTLWTFSIAYIFW